METSSFWGWSLLKSSTVGGPPFIPAACTWKINFFVEKWFIPFDKGCMKDACSTAPSSKKKKKDWHGNPEQYDDVTVSSKKSLSCGLVNQGPQMSHSQLHRWIRCIQLISSLTQIVNPCPACYRETWLFFDCWDSTGEKCPNCDHLGLNKEWTGEEK